MYITQFVVIMLEKLGAGDDLRGRTSGAESSNVAERRQNTSSATPKRYIYRRIQSLLVPYRKTIAASREVFAD